LDKLSEKQTPDQNLIHAVRKNNLDEVKDAIDSGANINCTVNLADDSQAQYHMRLFSFAYRMAKIKKDDYKIVNHLLKKGVDYFGLDDLKDDSAISKMIADLRENDCEITEFLNQKNINGDTPLHLACIGNKTQTAMQLIEAGVDTTAMNNQDKQAKDLTEDLGLKSLILPRELSSLGTHSSYPSSTASSVSARTSMSGRNI
jgi:ankyrin repeat protein